MAYSFKKASFIAITLCVLLTFFTCNSSDEQEDYVPLVIETNPDSASLIQNSQVDIPIFQNDSNIPSSGVLVLSDPLYGDISVVDINNTPQNLSDDIIRYASLPNIVGGDMFEYTICEDASQTNCKTESVSVTIGSASNVNYNLETMPYQTLSAYNFFSGTLKDLTPTFGVLPYDLNSALFSDYAKKKRFLWMPPNVMATYNEDANPLNFPVGTIIIKNFYYEHVLPNDETKILETRLMIKKDDGWTFAEYIWNDTQTEAEIETNGSYVSFDWVEIDEIKSVNYRIPSIAECFTCHNKFGVPQPIGPKPQNLNKDYNYAEGTSNQLSKWVGQGYLENNLPSTINTTVNWNDDSLPLDLRARSYIDINCAHCHSDESYCEYRPMRFAYFQNNDETNIGICVTPDTQVEPYTKIVVPQNIDLSLLHFRMSTTEQQYRMPLLGRTLKHEEGVRLIEQWINSLETACQ